MLLYVIGEPCCWLQKDETIAQGKVIAPCNANGDARTLDKNGKPWLINSTSIWTGAAALAVGEATPAVSLGLIHVATRGSGRYLKVSRCDRCLRRTAR